MAPSPSNSNVTLPPATTGTGAVTPPEKTSWPARSPSPSAASWFASQATDAAGCPMTAAPAAVMATSPSTRTTHPSRRRSTSSSGRRAPRAPEQARVHRLVGARGQRAEVEGTGTGVVGDDVGEGELEALVAGVEDVDGTEHDLGGGEDRGHRGRCLDVPGEEEGDLGLHPRVDEPVQLHGIAVGRDHPARDAPVQRCVETHGLLFVAAGQPELVADEGLTGVQLGLHERLLSAVGGRHVDVGMVVADLGDPFPLAFGGDQDVGDALGVDHADPSFEKRTVTAPRWAYSARNTSPGCTGTILWTAPGSTMSPALSPSPRLPSVLASHATQRAGLPRIAAPAPVSSSSPFREMATPRRRRSRSATGRIRPPITNSPDDALSATVSTSLIFQSATRLSTTSTAGRTPAMASRATAALMPGPARSRDMTKASSASTRGCTSRDSWIRSPSSTSISSVRTPKSGSSTPSSCCIGFEVRPTLRPITRSPAAVRRSTLMVWIAYASSIARSAWRSVSGGTGLAARSASHSSSASSWCRAALGTPAASPPTIRKGNVRAAKFRAVGTAVRPWWEGRPAGYGRGPAAADARQEGLRPVQVHGPRGSTVVTRLAPGRESPAERWVRHFSIRVSEASRGMTRW